ncbi:MAG: formylglycine-generating enzyme family protein [Polyangiaceae bacterium]
MRSGRGSEIPAKVLTGLALFGVTLLGVAQGGCGAPSSTNGVEPREGGRAAPATSTETAGPVAAVERPPMIRLQAGKFERGRARPWRPDEAPPHVVELSAFEIDATLVTRDQFATFVAETGYVSTAEKAGYGVSAHEGMDDWEWERVARASWRRPFGAEDADTAGFLRGDAPVVMVSWLDAVAYCEHYGLRLPTEAEWEYAMRAGSEGTRFPWGDEPERDGRLALNFWQGESHHENARVDGFVYVSPVRAFPPNRWGIYDPAGNVWQWVADWYAKDTYALAAAASPVHDPRGPESGRSRILRGGSWWCGSCTCAGYGLYYRGKALPTATFNNNGFRCARSVGD